MSATSTFLYDSWVCQEVIYAKSFDVTVTNEKISQKSSHQYTGSLHTDKEKLSNITRKTKDKDNCTNVNPVKHYVINQDNCDDLNGNVNGYDNTINDNYEKVIDLKNLHDIGEDGDNVFLDELTIYFDIPVSFEL